MRKPAAWCSGEHLSFGVGALRQAVLFFDLLPRSGPLREVLPRRRTVEGLRHSPSGESLLFDT